MFGHGIDAFNTPVVPQDSGPCCCAAVDGESVPRAAVSRRSKRLLNQLVSTGEQAGWYNYAKCLRCFEIDCKLELRRLLNRQLTSWCAAQDAGDVVRNAEPERG